MNNYIIPTTIIDNFFDDPVWVKEFALSQQFNIDPNHHWPGKRTKDIAELNPVFFNHILNKFFATFYDYQTTPIGWKAEAFFQSVDSVYDTGWVHSDYDTLITGIVYLNEGNNSGTTIYEAITPGTQLLNTAMKREGFKYPENIEHLAKYRDENNNQFKESIIVKNKFNRLLAFDAFLHHAANNFFGNNNDSRLTLVIFISKIDVNAFPLQRLKRTI